MPNQFILLFKLPSILRLLYTLWSAKPKNKLIPTINIEYDATTDIYDAIPDIIKNANRPITAPVNNNTTHRISNIDLTPTIEDVEINIQYNKNKNINVLK